MYVLDWRQGHEGDGGVNITEWRAGSWECAQMHMLHSDLPRWAAILDLIGLCCSLWFVMLQVGSDVKLHATHSN
jgi:hypothetical protein